MNNERRQVERPQRYVPPRPSLILLMGVAGTGKTTLGRQILRRLHAVYLDNNHIADAFYPDTRNSDDYRAWRPRFYRALYAIAHANLILGNSVLLDAPHVKDMQLPEWRRDLEQLVASAKAMLIVIRCFCSETVLKTRLNERGETRDQWKIEHWRDFLSGEPIIVSIPFEHIDVNTEQTVSVAADIAVRYIQQRCEIRS